MILCIPFSPKLNDAMYSQKLKHHKIINVVSGLIKLLFSPLSIIIFLLIIISSIA